MGRRDSRAGTAQGNAGGKANEYVRAYAHARVRAYVRVHAHIHVHTPAHSNRAESVVEGGRTTSCVLDVAMLGTDGCEHNEVPVRENLSGETHQHVDTGVQTTAA